MGRNADRTHGSDARKRNTQNRKGNAVTQSQSQSQTQYNAVAVNAESQSRNKEFLLERVQRL